MRFILLTAAVVVASTGVTSMAGAQSADALNAPAEVPPASFTEREYVDSRGCLYARATINGSVTWVPRVGSDRRVICGAEPSLSSTAGTTAVEEPAAGQPEIAGTTSATPAQPVVLAPVPRQTRTASRPATPVKKRPVTRDTTRLQPATPETVAPNVRIAPRRVVEAQLAAKDGVYVPRGYERVWTDDRLSLTRAHQTYAGQAQSAQIWTEGAPRRQVAREDGQSRVNEGVSVPRGYEPVWDDERLSRTRGQQTASGREQMAQFWDNQTPRRLVPRKEAPSVGISSKSPAAAQTVSSHSSGAPESVPASHRYIEAGAFETEDKARQAAGYIARAGLPAALSRRAYQGRSYATALAGPFATQDQLDRAYVKILKSYPGAKLRR